MTVPVIQIDGLTRRFGQYVALNHVDLDVPAGEFLAMAGHNGAGKSTLFKLLLGLMKPTAGNMRVFGENPCGRGARRLRQRIGFLPENVIFAGNLTGLELLRFFARLRGAPVGDCDGLLDLVGLTDARKKRIRAYSKGMRQRLGLAHVLLGEADILILDEPTTGLDPESRRHMFELLRERKARGATILLSSHTLSEVEEHADRLALLKDGQLVACGSPSELRRESALPIRINVESTAETDEFLAGGISDLANVTFLNGRKIELECGQDKQTELLGRLSEIDSQAQIEVRAPRLEDIYHHFQNPEGQA
jgi:Cu-processing system ATP-binding protein